MQTKRMLELRTIKTDKGDKFEIDVNSSSLSLIQTCKRKAKYILLDGIRGESSPAQSFGSIVHAAMADFYLRPIADRRPDDLVKDFQHRFNESGYAPEDDVRTIETGTKIMAEYQSAFSSDCYTVALDPTGKPIVERDFQFTLFDSPKVKINWFGRIDMLAIDEKTGEYVLFDHKTSRSLGQEFFNRYRNSHQFTGYALGAESIFLDFGKHVSVKRAVVNGLQVAKTKQQTARQEITIDGHRVDEFRETVFFEVMSFLKAIEAESYPMTDSSCSTWGGCQFLDACAASGEVRRNILQTMKEKGVNNA